MKRFVIGVVVLAATALIVPAGTAGATTQAVDCARTTITRYSQNYYKLEGVRITNKCSSTIGYARMHIFADSSEAEWTEPTPVPTPAGASRYHGYDYYPYVSRGRLVCGEWLDTAGRILGRDCITM